MRRGKGFLSLQVKPCVRNPSGRAAPVHKEYGVVRIIQYCAEFEAVYHSNQAREVALIRLRTDKMRKA